MREDKATLMQEDFHFNILDFSLLMVIQHIAYPTAWR
jgi:hypothetical protein